MMNNSPFSLRDHIWAISDGRYYSSLERDFVDAPQDGRFVTHIGSDTELWDVLTEQCPECLPDTPDMKLRVKDRTIANLGAVSLRALLNIENRMRALEKRSEITFSQFKSGLRDLINGGA